MAKRQRTVYKKEHLQKLGLVGKINENNEFELWKGNKKLNVYKNTTKHKVSGRHITYNMYLIYVSNDNALNTGTRIIHDEYICILQHVASYLWFKGDIPHELDVDHIDNDKLNNHPDNLQLLTRADNLRKNGIGRNQYSWNLTEEEILENRTSKIERNKKIKERVLNNKLKQAQIRNFMEFYRNERDFLDNKIEELKKDLLLSTVVQYRLKKKMIGQLKEQKTINRTNYKKGLIELKREK